MFWLAGLLGLMAVGSAVFFDDDTDVAADEDGLDDGADPATETPDGEGGPGLLDIPSPQAGMPPGPVAEPDPAAPGSDLILSGTEQAETLTGGGGDDQINGYDGDDLVFGRGGDDDLHGSDGNDTLAGGGGNDTIHGEDGDDVLHGGSDDDQLFGHLGDDRLDGGSGHDTIHGGQGDYDLAGGKGDDALHGNAGDDRLTGGDGADTLFGGDGNDTLSGLDDEADYLNGGAGDDWLVAGGGDIVTGGDGADTVVLGDWLADAGAVELIDYDPADDQLVVLWDQAGAPDPQIEIRTDADNPTLSHILLDGVEIAAVDCDAALTVADILLVDRAGFAIPTAA